MNALSLGILSTHPIQYHAPLYRALARRGDVELTVFYAHRPTPAQQGEGFGRAFEWDTDLLAGYRSVFLENRAAARGTGFLGYDTPSIAAEILPGRFDAFLVSGWHARTYLQAIRVCRRTRTPVMVRGDSYLHPSEAKVKRVLKRMIYPFFLRRLDACLSVGTRSDAYFSYYGARRVARVPHFVDNDRFATASRVPGKRDELRSRWGIAQDAFVCAFAGKLVPGKRPMDLVRAAAEIGAHLLVAGDGVLRAECDAEAARLDVPATFLGFVNQTSLPEVYAAADVLALPSESETWGLVVNEAMASGLPVVVSNAVGCVPDLVLPGQTGFTFPVGNVHSLAGALHSVRESIAAGEHLGANARMLIETFTAERSAEALVAVAREVAVARGPRSRRAA